MGGGGELEASILETPTFVLSIVFFVFLALSFIFELVVHATQSFFIRRGRHGMANAVQKIVMELTLLGFVSLLLTTFSTPLGRACMSWSDAMADWTLESNIPGCPCCLAKTQGVSLCTQMDHECLWNVTSLKPFCDCDVTGTADYAAAGYAAYAPTNQLHDECEPYKITETQFFIDVSMASLHTISSALNISITDVCSALANGTRLEAAYGSIDPSLLGDLDKLGEVIDGWGEGERRRRLLGSTSAGLLGSGSRGGQGAGTRDLLGSAGMAGPPIGGGCGGQHAGGRRLLAGGGGGAAAGGTNPLQVLLSQDPNATTQRHLLPRISLFKCTGPFMSSSCPDGQVPLISENALHQMHIYLFLVAIFHVAVSVVQFLLGRLRLRLWRRWERQAKRAGPQAAPPPAAPLGRLQSGVGRGSSLAQAPSGKTAPAANGARDSSTAAAPAEPAGTDVEAAAAAATALNGEGSSSTSGGALRPWALLRLWCGRVRQRWRVRHPRMPSAWHCLAEAGICLVQALSPDTVTRQNFLLVRAAWRAGQPAHPLDTTQHAGLPKEEEQREGQAGKEERSEAGPQQQQQQQQQQQPASGAGGGGAAGGGAGAVCSGCGGRCSGAVSGRSQQGQAAAQPDFVDHLMDCLEDDLPSFVGLSVEMGVVACVLLLLAGLTGWIGPLFLIVASALLLGTNMTLVALLRHSCRGGQPHSSARKPIKWWRNPHLLLAIPIRLILFLCSFVYSSVVLFAWQFGNLSCFFTSEGDVWGVGGLPWWTSLVWVATMLLWVGLVTIPTFSLVVHPHRATRVAAAPLGHGSGHPGDRADAHAGHAGHAHNISMLLDAAMSGGVGGGTAPKAGSICAKGSQQAVVQAGTLPDSADGSSGGGGGSLRNGDAGPKAELLAEISRLRARVAQLEALQASYAANGAAAKEGEPAGAAPGDQGGTP
ncbi:hypothetical protein ABPG75_012180 [Micractinium tetrahymenae]